MLAESNIRVQLCRWQHELLSLASPPVWLNSGARATSLDRPDATALLPSHPRRRQGTTLHLPRSAAFRTAHAAHIYNLQVGTSVVTRSKDQRLALGRLGALVEALEYLVRDGKQVILVTSGATAVGRQKLRFQQVLNSSPLEMQISGLSSLQARAAAAAGQSGLMALYDSMFQMMDMQCSQFLVTSRDFKNEDFIKNLNLTVDQLLEMNVVPVINENDSISSVRFRCLRAEHQGRARARAQPGIPPLVPVSHACAWTGTFHCSQS